MANRKSSDGANAPEAKPADAADGAMFDDFLPYLVTRLAHLLNSDLIEKLRREGINLARWRILAVLAMGDGVTFLAKTDNAGKRLDGNCDVTVSGVTPAARFWTLTVYDMKGRLVANSLQRYGFTSEEVVRGSNGSFEVRIAARARAGNWLPTGGIDHYQLALRFYDTPVGAATRTQKDAPMPTITTVGCP